MLVNRAKMTTATTGTGTITLGSAVDGYQTFAAAGVTDAAVVSYAIEDGTAWEIGTGTYTASGTTLSRTVTESSNAGAAITLTGNAVVFVTARAEDIGGFTIETSSGASQSVDFSTSNKIHVATIAEDTTINFVNPAQVAKLDLVLDVGGTPYDLANASYDGVSFDVSAQETSPYGVYFKSDGTKAYVVGTDSASVHQYSLSTAWDLSTASYDSVSFSVSAQDAFPLEVVFKNDGTKMYIMGATDVVFQYSLSTAWDLSTASYDSVSFSGVAQSLSLTSIAFKVDGTKMYLSGVTGSVLYQYSLSTAWDVGTASYDSVSFSSGVANPSCLDFKDDGKKLYVGQNATDTVDQFNLSTAWDLSTASSDGISFSVDPQSGAGVLQGIRISGGGDKLYAVVRTTNAGIYQYTIQGAPSVTLPANLEAPTIPLVVNEKTALTIATYDGGTTYQAINVQGGIA